MINVLITHTHTHTYIYVYEINILSYNNYVNYKLNYKFKLQVKPELLI